MLCQVASLMISSVLELEAVVVPRQKRVAKIESWILASQDYRSWLLGFAILAVRKAW